MAKEEVIKIVALFSLAAVTLPVGASGQERQLPVITFPEQPLAQWQGDSLMLTFTSRLQGGLIGNVAYRLIPLYVCDGDTLTFPQQVYATRRFRQYSRRREALGGTTADVAQTMTVGKGDTAECSYSQRLLVDHAKGGKVEIAERLETCCDFIDFSPVAVAIGQDIEEDSVDIVPVYYAEEITQETTKEVSEEALKEVPQEVLKEVLQEAPIDTLFIANVAPVPQEFREQEAVADVRLSYRQGSREIDETYNGNADELSSISRLLEPLVADDPNYRIISLTVTAYASPEGIYEDNLQLSRQRAESMKNYLKRRYPRLGEVNITTVAGGEDWRDLRRLIVESSYAWKAEALDIIDNTGLFQGREKRLMDLHSGNPYRQMMAELFPILRRIEIKVIYKALLPAEK